MASKVPFEIWLNIADHLPRVELQGLYALNSAFFHAAMDARYQEVDVLVYQYFDVAKVLRKLEQLSQPHVVCRVRSIKIDLSSYGPYKDPYLGFPTKNPSGDRILDCKCLCEEMQLSIAMKKTLPSLLSCITKCKLVFSGDSAARRLIPSLWSALGSNLQSLELHSPLGDICSLLRSAPTHFPTLEHVHITFSQYVRPPIPDEVFLTSIIPFLNRHSSTLSSLTIFNRYGPLADMSCLLNTLGYFPWLRHLGFYIGYVSDTHIQMSDPGVLTQFLKNHADQLQSCTIHVITIHKSFAHHSDLVEYEDISHSLLNVPFPDLLKLEISSCRDTFRRQVRTLGIIPWFSDTLTTLILRNSPFTHEQVETLASCFRCRPEDTRLKILSFRVNTISPEFVDLLAYRFPGLVRLTLGADALKPKKPTLPSRIRPTTSIPSGELEEFQVEMEKRVYDKWGLCHLDIETSPNASFSSVVEIIEKRIPNIQRMREGL